MPKTSKNSVGPAKQLSMPVHKTNNSFWLLEIPIAQILFRICLKVQNSLEIEILTVLKSSI